MSGFDIIVVGGGHAGIEASAASAKLGFKTLLLTLNRKMIGNTPCNPHIGGSAKGVVTREIDALGGLQGILADHDPIQIKMLNTGKGPGVQCLRAQVDKIGYPAYAQKVLSEIPNLSIEEGEAKSLLHDGKVIFGVRLKDRDITAKAVILTTGTYMASTIIAGNDVHEGGPDGEPNSNGLSESLKELGLKIFRLKTGTPPRIDKDSIDFSKTEPQPGHEGELAFSYGTTKFQPLENQLPCYLTYTTEETHRLILDHLSESAVMNGTITGTGPRYCPSIESKIVRFQDKERHQLFLEPEYREGNSIYLQGFSTGFPREFQEKLVRTIPGLEHAKILKYAYQIEYDALMPFQFDASLAVKGLEGLYVAGQICGTSGYEEAAGLGLMAGINAARKLQGKDPFILRRDEAYIGVMIDDLVTKGTEEPYRLLSSRAEFRLLLRHDNADERLSEHGYQIGLLSKERHNAFLKKEKEIEAAKRILTTTNVSDKEGIKDYLLKNGYSDIDIGHKGAELLKRPKLHYEGIAPHMAELKEHPLDSGAILTLETEIKYEGYIRKALDDAKMIQKQEGVILPEGLDYLSMDGLRLEARQKLDMVHPRTIGQAGRISGVNPADISVLLLTLRKRGLL